jgi:hypothetical protein
MFYEFNRLRASQTFPLYAFILATGADGNIFPGLFSYYVELHVLTGPYVMVFAPTFRSGYARSPEDVARLIRTIVNDTQSRSALEHILDRHTTESYQFAKVCGISVDRLPCILFFDRLDDPTNYLMWQVRDATAQTIVRDFRTIISRVRDAQAAGEVDLLGAIERLKIVRGFQRIGRATAGAIPLVASLLKIAETLSE